MKKRKAKLVGKVCVPSEVIMIHAEISLFQDGHFRIDTKARRGVDPNVVMAFEVVLKNAISSGASTKEARLIVVQETNQAEPKPELGFPKKCKP